MEAPKGVQPVLFVHERTNIEIGNMKRRGILDWELGIGELSSWTLTPYGLNSLHSINKGTRQSRVPLEQEKN